MEINTVLQEKLLKDFEEKWKLMAPSHVAQRSGITCLVDPTTEAYMRSIAFALYLDGVQLGLDLGDKVAKKIFGGD